jgi:chromosome segregation ATPase
MQIEEACGPFPPSNMLQSRYDAAHLALETLGRDRERWRTEASRVNAELTQSKAELEQSRAALAHSDVAVEQSKAELEQSRAALAHSNVALEQCNAELEQSRAALAHSRAELDRSRAAFEELEISRSWRVTLVLRRGGKLLRQLRAAARDAAKEVMPAGNGRRATGKGDGGAPDST